ncbi:cobalamin-binding protein [Nonomuraea sp. WAC 01424]|uniref:cobalamin B12-binding domain-containing protein n=1 Tax=Nonomuraea sp. WAC 01424 TaxID=2203200 RepID=UPI000F76D02D|nr:cobalamin B12-binding domain-containing protein [Nonomuraea sp. WAC 01424]RSN04913.1 cobalamin-binding protein [Nonomuraea sp. WAC 01424]
MNDEAERCAEALWAAATAGDEYAAIDAARAALDAGVPLETMLLDVVAVAQARVGLDWVANRLTVAQEHTATAVHERVLAVMAHEPAVHGHRAGPSKGRVSVACVDGEWHTFPARLLAEVLRLRGWQVDYLGAHVPTAHLVVHVHRTAPGTVALSGSIATRLPAAHAAITACQAAGVPVLVGGAAFGPDGRYARLLGADAWAPDARAAADLLDAGPLPRRSAAGLSADRPPHLAGHEYTLLTERAPELVRGVMADLDERVPVAEGTEPAGHTAEEVAYAVDFLRAAVYVDDPALFASFTGWTARMLATRDAPARLPAVMLDALDARLAGLPRTREIVALARAGLR